MSKIVINRWKRVTPEKIALAIYEVVKDDFKLLKVNSDDAKLVWGQIAARVGSSFKSKVDRQWLKAAWEGNVKGVKDLVHQKCSLEEDESTSQPEQSDVPQEVKEPCGVCRKPEGSVPSYPMINCTGCQKWFHCSCVKVTKKTFLSSEDWHCPRCTLQDSADFLPKIFNRTEQSSFSTAQQEHEYESRSPESSVDSPVDEFPSPRFASTPAQNVSRGDESDQFEVFEQPNSPQVSPDADAGNSEDELRETFLDTNERNEGPITITNVKFTADVANSEWQNIKPSPTGKTPTDRKYLFRLTPNTWTHVFTKAFIQNAPSQFLGCRLSFKGHKITVTPGENPKPVRVTTKAVCSRGLHTNTVCEMVYHIVINNIPLDGENALLQISCSGVLHHDLTTTNQRKLAGTVRQEAKKHLIHDKPSVHRRKVYADKNTNQGALEKGNLTEVQTLKALQDARNEVLKDQDLDKNIMVDIIQRRIIQREKEELKGFVLGYIQELSIFPFYAALYTTQQFSILKRLLKLDPYWDLHIDSTGSLSFQLPAEYGNTQQYYYALTTTLPGINESPCVPLLEFVSNSHSAVTLSSILHRFFSRFGEYIGERKGPFGFRRMETDCSKALISAILQGLELGTTEMYIKDAFCSLMHERKMKYVHHICRSHALNFVNKKIESHYPRDDDSIKLLKTWINAFVHGKDLWDFQKRVEEVVLICGKKRQTTAVKEISKSWGEQAIKTDPLICVEIDLDRVQNAGAFYSRSPFGHFAILRCFANGVDLPASIYHSAGIDLDCETENGECDEDGEKNLQYNVAFLEYLLREVFSVACLMDHSLLNLHELSDLADTNATSESWNKILKRDELQKDLPMKVSRLIPRLEELIKGRLRQFELGVGRYERSVRSAAQKNASSAKGKRSKNARDNMESDPERSQESWRPKKGNRPPATTEDSPIHRIARIPYGGTVTVSGKQFILRNTCNVDNILQILYCFWKLDTATEAFLKNLARDNTSPSYKLVKLFDCLDRHDWSSARFIALVEMIRISDEELQDGDMYESEDRLLTALNELICYEQVMNCSNPNCRLPKKNTVYPMNDMMYSNPQQAAEELKSTKIINSCFMDNSKKLTIARDWPTGGAPPFFCYAFEQVETQCKEKDLQDQQNLLGVDFELFSYTVLESSHYTTVFRYRGKKHIYNGLRESGLQKYKPFGVDHTISTVWLKRKI